EHATIRPNDAYIVNATGTHLRRALVKKRESLFASLAALNDAIPELGRLKSYLVDCAATFTTAGQLLESKFGRDLLGLGELTAVPVDGSRGRLCVPLDKVIDTGVNLAVFGDAGAGKTTSLQMYAAHALAATTGRPAIYAPLTRVVRARE